jgi:hypothetical protein
MKKVGAVHSIAFYAEKCESLKVLKMAHFPIQIMRSLFEDQ